MGEHADDILDGSCCQHCGDWFHDGGAAGHPRSCGCTSTRTNKNRRKRDKIKRRKAEALAAADKKGWTSMTPYHFRKMVGGENLDWWPSTGKYFWRGKVIDEATARGILK